MTTRTLFALMLTACTASAPTTDDDVVDTGDSAPTEDANAPFGLVVVPDTQFVSLLYPEYLDAVGTWVAEHAEERNLKAVLHEGDMVQNATEPEWANLLGAIAPFRDDVPFLFCVGNHDLDEGGGTDSLNRHLGVSEYEGETFFGDVATDGRIDDAWYTFEAQGLDWIVLSIAWGASDDVLDWGLAALQAHPDHLAIVLTHDHLDTQGAWSSRGAYVWDRMISKAPNARFVFSGHHTPIGASRLESTGDAGNVVYQMFANYQNGALGGAGTVRLMTMDALSGTVGVETYVPYLDSWLDGPDEAFTLTGVDLEQPGE